MSPASTSKTATDRANAVITQVSAAGTVCFWSSSPTYLVVDVNGWFKAPPGYNPGRAGPTPRHASRGATGTAATCPRTRLAPGRRARGAGHESSRPGTGHGGRGRGAQRHLDAIARQRVSHRVAVRPDPQLVQSQLPTESRTAPTWSSRPSLPRARSASRPTTRPISWSTSTDGSRVRRATPRSGPLCVADTRTGTAGLRTVPAQRVAPGSVLTVQLTDLPGGLVPGIRGRGRLDQRDVDPTARQRIPHRRSLRSGCRNLQRQLPGRPRPGERRRHAGLGGRHDLHHDECRDRRRDRRERLVLERGDAVTGSARLRTPRPPPRSVIAIRRWSARATSRAGACGR